MMKSYITIIGFAIFLEMIYLMPVFAAESGYYAIFDNHHKIAFRLYTIDLQYNSSIDSINSCLSQNFNLNKVEQFRFNYRDTVGLDHIVYGNPNSLVNTSVIDFTFDSTNSIINISDKLSDSTLARFCANVITTNDSVISNATKDHILLSPYTIIANDTINLYFMPSFQTTGIILLSSDYYFKYLFDRSSNRTEFISCGKDSVETRRFDPKQSREIVLNYPYEDVPTIESLFFAHIYFPYFEKITISTKEKETGLLDIKTGNYVHINKNN